MIFYDFSAFYCIIKLNNLTVDKCYKKIPKKGDEAGLRRY